MLLIRCPWCGPREESEFSYGGEAHIVRPKDPYALDDADWVPWCTTRDLGPQLSCTLGFEVPHEHFQTHSAEVCEEGLSREELA